MRPGSRLSPYDKHLEGRPLLGPWYSVDFSTQRPYCLRHTGLGCQSPPASTPQREVKAVPFQRKKWYYYLIDKRGDINKLYPCCLSLGGVAQSVRACGSYPQSHWFESSHRHHQTGSLPLTFPEAVLLYKVCGFGNQVFLKWLCPILMIMISWR